MSNRKLGSAALISPKALELLTDLKTDIATAAKATPGQIDSVKGALRGFGAIEGGKDAAKQAMAGQNYNDGSGMPYRDGTGTPYRDGTGSPYRDGSGPYKDGWSRYKP